MNTQDITINISITDIDQMLKETVSPELTDSIIEHAQSKFFNLFKENLCKPDYSNKLIADNLQSIDEITSGHSIEDIQLNQTIQTGSGLVQHGGELFHIAHESTKHIAKFKTSMIRWTIEFDNENSLDFLEMQDQIHDMFEKVYQKISGKINNNNDKVRIIFGHDDLDVPVSSVFLSFSDFSAQLMYDLIYRVCQSKRSLSMNSDLRLLVQIVNIPRGGCQPSNLTQSEYNLIYNDRRGLVNVDCGDSKLCALYSIVMAINFMNKKYINQSLKMATKRRKIDSQVEEIVEALNLGHLSNIGLGFNEIQMIELYLKKYQITVYLESDLTKPAYTGVCNEPNRKFIYLFLSHDHYYLIKTIKSFMRTPYFCDSCKIAYTYINGHKCEALCSLCQYSFCPKSKDNMIECKSCKKKCYGKDCHERHRKDVCYDARKCIKCGSINLKSHICIGQKKCDLCKCGVDDSHQCFVLTDQEKKQRAARNKKQVKYLGKIFFDFENYRKSDGESVPNLAVSIKVCNSCAAENRDCTRNDCRICEIKYFYNTAGFL